MPKVSAEHRVAVRQSLLDAARRVLARRGYEGTTARDIVAEAGVSTGTLYNYFAGKDDLIEALSEEVIATDLVAFRALEGEGTDVVLRLLRDFVFTQPGDGTPVLAQLRGRVSTDPEVRDAVARFNRYIVELFRPLVKEADLREGADVDALIELVDIVWDGMTRRAAGGSFTTSYERVGAVCSDLLLKGALRHDDP
jgi:AcrR family transcriptional regulator